MTEYTAIKDEQGRYHLLQGPPDKLPNGFSELNKNLWYYTGLTVGESLLKDTGVKSEMLIHLISTDPRTIWTREEEFKIAAVAAGHAKFFIGGSEWEE